MEIIWSRSTFYKGQAYTISIIKNDKGQIILIVTRRSSEEKEKIVVTSLDMEAILKLHKIAHEKAKELGLELK